MSRRDDAVILDLLKAGRLAMQFLGEQDLETFHEDLKTQVSVQHQLMLLGEGVKRLSDGFRTNHPALPWRAIAGMRDTLIHEYDDVDLEEVWHTVKRDVPALIRMLEPLAPPR